MKFLGLIVLLCSTAARAEDSLPISFALGNSFYIALQGEASGSDALMHACGATGRLCACEFRDRRGTFLGKTEPQSVSYEASGNYFRCAVPLGIPLSLVAQAQLTGPGHVASRVLPVKTMDTLTLPELVGPDLDANRVRHVYRYECEENYLQKAGTSVTGFDCSNQAAQCGGGDNFCLLRVHAPYFLYADTYGSNMSTRPADSFYNEEVGGICGLMIRRLDCVSGGVPEVLLGLYEGQAGNWKEPIALPPAPGMPSSFVGYAAAPSPTTGECPPGLMASVPFRAMVDATGLVPSSNLPDSFSATEIVSAGQVPRPFAISRISGGHCDGTKCSMPSDSSGTAKEAPYSAAGQAVLCVIPPSLLP